MSLSDLPAFLWFVLDTRRYELGFIFAAVLFEVVVRSSAVKRLLSKSYALDLFYCAVYRLGVFTILLDRPLRDFLYEHLTFQLIAAAPIWVRVAMYLILLELANYWIHRLSHAIPFLWAFHQVHHSQDELTIMTTYRNHPVDILLRNFGGPILFMLLLGIPPEIWLPVSLLWDINLNLSHLEVGWTYGPLRWLLVSPVFHGIHHSVEGRHQASNFSQTLPILDIIFGTADTSSRRPHK